MPMNAIKRGQVDHILPISMIAAAVVSLVGDPMPNERDPCARSAVRADAASVDLTPRRSPIDVAGPAFEAARAEAKARAGD